MASSFFSLEICMRIDPGSTLLSDMRTLILAQRPTCTMNEKWQVAERASGLLLGNLHHADRGCWEYFDEEMRAKELWTDWSKVVETKTGARTTKSGAIDPYRGGTRYMTVTMAYLLVRDSPTDEKLRMFYNVGEARLWKRETFTAILSAIPHVSFASVRGDTLYMIPGDDEWGLTDDDLADAKFNYLRKIE
ncbi:hypothetical protein BH09MYX1_BH09MYX1_02700 [soil metagenome]